MIRSVRPLSSGLPALRRSAMTRMPNARARRAVACAMWPYPTRPSVRPRSSAITNLSHTRAFRLSMQRGTCLTKWSAAAIAYSASDAENAPRPLVSGTSLSASSFAKPPIASTPA
eukprot:6829297-Prymnesium_polylepis.1